MPGRPPGSTSTTSGISFRTSGSAADHRTKLQDFSLSVDTLRDRNKVKRLSAKHVIQVEYWISSIGSWTEKAQISISTKKTKLYLNVRLVFTKNSIFTPLGRLVCRNPTIMAHLNCRRNLWHLQLEPLLLFEGVGSQV